MIRADFYLDKYYLVGKTENEQIEIRNRVKVLKRSGKNIPDELLNPKETAIYLYVRIGKSTIKVKTGDRIYPKYWNLDNQQAKRFFTGSTELNERLNYLRSELMSKYRILTLESEEIYLDDIERLVNEILEGPKQKDSQKEFVEAFEQFIEIKEGDKSISTVKKYRTLLQHLINFQSEKKCKLNFKLMDLGFYERLKSYMILNLKHTNNTVAKHTTMLRTFLRWAEDRNYTTSENYKKFKAGNEHVDIICLSEDELFRIYNADFSQNKKLERVRDTFCFGCFTGQRFSDLANIKRDDIKGSSWFIRTKKTRDIIEIPLNEYALEILNKYSEEWNPIPVMSNQKMNDYLKEIGEHLSIDDQITRVRYSGAKRIEKTEPKYNFISTHTARRTFVTLSLEKGMRPETVMNITGHKDFKTLQRYIRISSKVKKAEMNNIWKRESLLKVV